MSKLDDILSKAKEVAATATKKTGDFVEVAKLNSEISDKLGHIKDLMTQMGQIVYDIYKSKSSDEIAESAALDDNCKLIDGLYGEIDELREKIAEIKNSQPTAAGAGAQKEAGTFCPSCGNKVETDSVFCPKCGNKLQ